MERQIDSVSIARRPAAGDLVELLRPSQWIKNIVVFAAPAAGLKLFTADGFLKTLLAFAAFCLAASATYCFNDVIDREADSRHPVKRRRPVARGALSAAAAVCIGVALLAAAGLVASLLPRRAVLLVVALYFLLTVTYSLRMKRWVIVDVIAISMGFVLRAWAGALAVGVTTSAWLVACVFTLCLFMGFGKRRCELAMLGTTEEAGQHRKTLVQYTPDLLNHLITVSAGIAVVTFLLYTMDTVRAPSPFPREQLFFTLPIVIYGIFRFAMVTELGLHSGPTEIVLKDRPMLAAILVWVAAAMVIAYQAVLFGPAGLPGLLRTISRM